MIHNIKLSDTVLTVSLPSERLVKFLQFYINNSVDLSGRIDWNLVRRRAEIDLKHLYFDFSDYSFLLCAITDLCNFDTIYPIVF